MTRFTDTQLAAHAKAERFYRARTDLNNEGKSMAEIDAAMTAAELDLTDAEFSDAVYVEARMVQVAAAARQRLHDEKAGKPAELPGVTMLGQGGGSVHSQTFLAEAGQLSDRARRLEGTDALGHRV